ncbi:MAG: fibronectin type III domain-containing protein [Solirubrobacteraceae bacterium]
MRSRTLLLIALVALVGAAVAESPALAAPSKVKLEVNQNCVEPAWPCWTAETSPVYPQPALKVTITEGGEVEFADHDASRTASVVWTGGPATPSCPGVPTTTTASTNWEGTCTFATPGTYHFESSTMFYEPPGLYSNNLDYRKYEVVVTGPPTPTATTEQATAVTETEATLNGSVNPEGQATSYYFEYGSSESYGTKTGELSAGSGSTSQGFHFTWTGLLPKTTYYFQLVAVYGVNKTKVDGGNMTFKTAAPPSAPIASTQPATAVTETEATLKGTVNPDGEVTEYFFEYGTETSYGQKTGKVTLPAGESNQAVSAPVKGLTAGTEYHFRLVAENKHGPNQGLDQSFKSTSTPAKEPTKEPSPTPTTSITTSMQPPALSQSPTSPPVISTAPTKPLTRAQKLVKALKQCKKQPKKKRAKCEAKAKMLYGPKHKSHKK